MASDLARKAEEIFHGEKGVTEDPPNSNSGPRVNEYLAAVNAPPGNAWCAASACWSIKQACLALGVEHSIHFSAGALRLWEKNPDLQFKTLDADSLPCLGIYDHGGGKGHVVMAIGLDESTGTFQTIEGNGNLAGSRTGGSVVELNKRNVSDPQLVGFLRIE